MSLTERKIRDARPGAKTFALWDTEVIGLGVRVTPKGAKSFVLRYRVDGRERLAVIARCGEISLREARDRAGAERAAVRAGETDPLARRAEAVAAPTVAEAIDHYFAHYAPRQLADGRLAERTVAEYRRQADGTLRPALGKIKVADVTPADIERAVSKCAPVQRNRVLSFARRLFNLCEAWEFRPQHSNPARGADRAREEPRDRVLAPSELKALAGALGTVYDPTAADAIRFLMLTGWRVSEALAVRWDDVDFETGEITLPTTKAGRQVRPVGAAALAILAELPRVHGTTMRLPAPGRRPSDTASSAPRSPSCANMRASRPRGCMIFAGRCDKRGGGGRRDIHASRHARAQVNRDGRPLFAPRRRAVAGGRRVVGGSHGGDHGRRERRSVADSLQPAIVYVCSSGGVNVHSAWLARRNS